MPIITKEQVRKAIGLGTLNPKVINDFFYDIKLKSYDYDYKIQQDLIDLTSVENSFWDAFKKSMVIKDAVRDGKLDRVCVVQIDKDIVHYAKRKEYKLSKKYNKPLALKDIMANRDIFKFGVLCFINGKMNLNFKIQAREDKTFILFPRNDFAKTIKETDKFVVITGPNGSGKSTLAKIIMGIEKPTSGRIYFNDEDITDLTEEAHRKSVAATIESVADETGARTNDPVRLYLREMGAVELLSRDGEIAIAKRITAGTFVMMWGLIESPLSAMH